MRDRELLTLDLSAVVKELAERLPALVDRGHGRRIQEYDTCGTRNLRNAEKKVVGQ
jgi:5-methylthioadenosine/S-adenosylhomocysteine deaminase